MISMPAGFWAWWIVILTVGSLAGLAWIVWSTYFSKDVHAEADATGAQAPTVWDENLREGGRPAPMWWFWLILALLVISVIYLMLYPGLGAYRGAFNWSSSGHLSASLEKYGARFEAEKASILGMSIEDIQQSDDLLRKGESIFGRHCAACHGRDARGQVNRFPNLKDEEWMWGGSPLEIEKTIRGGRTAVMAGWGDSFHSDQLDQLADFILKMGKNEDVSEHPVRGIYDTFCVTCHLEDGTGKTDLGAPDLTNEIYLYGDDVLSIKYTIVMGRGGVMPAFHEILDDVEVRLLVAWITATP